MIRVIVETAKGWKKAFWIRDDDTTVEHGIPDAMPDLNRLDWEDIKKRLNDVLVEEGYSTWQDIQKRPDIFSGLVLSVVRNSLVVLYKVQESEVKNHDKFNSTS